MSLLEIIISVTGFIFFLMALDLYQRKKFTILHFLVFFGGTALVVLFAFQPGLLNQFGEFFGVARGADLLVYITIIGLAYLYFELLNKWNNTEYNLSRIIISQAYNTTIKREKNSGELEKMKNSNFCFLVRAYNEGSVIYQTLESIYQAGYTVIAICNDGSSDDTVGEIKRFQDEYKDCNVIVFNHLINRGAGSANKTLFRFAKEQGKKLGIEWFVTYDADGQMRIEDMETFKEYISDHKEKKAFLGSRFIKGGGAQHISWARSFVLLGSRIITLIFNKVLVSDPHNGYRVLHYDALKKITLEADGMLYASELVEQIDRYNIAFQEVPVTITYSSYSKKKGQKNSDAFKILKNLFLTKFIFKNKNSK